MGALIGAFAAYRLQVRESKKLGRGAARAVYIEISQNQTTARMAAERGADFIGGIRRDAWQAEQARLGAHLGPEQLLAVGWAYALYDDAVDGLEKMRRGAAVGSAPSFMLGTFAEAMADAAVKLLPAVWTDDERQRLSRHTKIPVRYRPPADTSDEP